MSAFFVSLFRVAHISIGIFPALFNYVELSESSPIYSSVGRRAEGVSHEKG